jgi:hypothetical protein
VRTTLTLDDDLAGALKRQARRLGIPFKQAVNQAIRAGLARQQVSRAAHVPVTIPHSFGFRAGVDLDKLGQLADELEAEEAAAGRRSRRSP